MEKGNSINMSHLHKSFKLNSNSISISLHDHLYHVRGKMLNKYCTLQSRG